MKKMKILPISLTIILTAGLIGANSIFSAPPPEKNRKIVVFQEGINEESQKEILKDFKADDIKELKSIHGRVANLSEKSLEGLNQRKEIKRIDDDIIIYALERPGELGKKPSGGAALPAEVLPWGVDRIDADLTWNTTTGDTVKVAVVDTGISLTHPDLKNNIKGGYNAINPRYSANDDNGHGSHVAGIIAAVDNKIGVIGVGPNIDLYAVKVLNRNGSGYLSDIIEGLDWCIANGIQVINMSLGTPTYNKSFEDAIKRVDAAGITQVAAAGNSGPYNNTVNYPAKFSEVIAVSAIDNTNTIAYFSSRGQEVDLTAPGANIYSTYKGTSYKTLNGTSMASPHVAGVAALVLDVKSCDYNLDGICAPQEVREKLQNSVEDLGALGKDDLYGYGLIKADKAIAR